MPISISKDELVVVPALQKEFELPACREYMICSFSVMCKRQRLVSAE